MQTQCLTTWALAAMIVLVGCRPIVRADILLSNVTVIDVEAGQAIAGQDVLVKDNLISHVFPHGSQSVEAPAVINGHGRYVIPGLWDMHAHIRSYDAADVLPMFIAHGVTGIRDLGLTSFSSIQQWKRDIIDGSLVGPRILSSGVIIEGAEPRFPSSISISSVEEIPRKLGPIVAQGVDLIKIFQNVPGQVFTGIVAYAREKGLPTAGHIPDEWGQIQAAESGLGSIEHFWGLEKALSYKKGRLDSIEVNRLAEVLKAHNTFECPTLINGSFILETESLAGHPQLESELFQSSPAMAYSPAYFRVWWDGIRRAATAPLKSGDYQDIRNQAAFSWAAVGALAARGVKFLAGTDTPNPYLPAGSSLHKELILLANAGLSHAEVLRTATIYPAEYFGRTADLGTVEVGRLADLVVLERNPLENIQNTTSVYAVIADGRLFATQDLVEIKRAQLRRLAGYRTTDMDQVIYMEVRRNGIAGARLKFPNLLHDSAVVAQPKHLIRLSASLLHAGEANEARQALEWNRELFPGDAVTRLQLDSLSSASRPRRLQPTSR